MDTRQLQYFLAIARHQNISKAAEELHISQPALSTTLRTLEQELGQQLFDRQGKKLVINENGRYLASRAKSAFDILDEAKTALQTSVQERNSTVNCAMEIPLGNMGEVLRQFYERHPSILIRMGYADSTQFNKRALDVILCSSATPIEDTNYIFLGKEDLMIVMPPNHSLAQRESVALADFKHDDFVFTNPSVMRNISYAMCIEAGFEPRIIMETQLFSEALSIVSTGLGCCIATEITWLGNMPYKVVVRKPTDVHRHRYLYARLPKHIAPSEATWAFINYLQDYAESITSLSAQQQPYV